MNDSKNKQPGYIGMYLVVSYNLFCVLFSIYWHLGVEKILLYLSYGSS